MGSFVVVLLPLAEDSVHAFLADHRRDLFPDEMFADLFPSGRGRPSVPAPNQSLFNSLLAGLCARQSPVSRSGAARHTVTS